MRIIDWRLQNMISTYRIFFWKKNNNNNIDGLVISSKISSTEFVLIDTWKLQQHIR